jgi:hypothetical protein
MSEVPTSLAGLLSLLAPCFTQPTFQTFCMLIVRFVGRIRDCTVTGMLQAAGLAAPSRSGSSPRQSRSPGTPFMATPKPTSASGCASHPARRDRVTRAYGRDRDRDRVAAARCAATRATCDRTRSSASPRRSGKARRSCASCRPRCVRGRGGAWLVGAHRRARGGGDSAASSSAAMSFSLCRSGACCRLDVLV